MGLLEKIKVLVAGGDYVISNHGYDELANDGILQEEVIDGLAASEIVESYPDYFKGPCVLVLAHSFDGEPVHALWGLARNTQRPAVLITAYRPDEKRWEAGFRRRK